MQLSDEILRASALLKEDELVAFPTETVYGLGGNALSDDAVAKIYAAKGRPSFNPLIIHLASAEAAQQYVKWNDDAAKLAAKFWPGPLTLVLPRAEPCAISLLASAGMDTLAVRVPAHPLAHELLEKSALPLAAPSANVSGRVSPTRASHVREELGEKVAMILDGGPCDIGVESTVVDLTGNEPVLLRPGSITREQLSAELPREVRVHKGEEVLAPGMLKSHYAPCLPVRLNAKEVEEDEALLAFGAQVPEGSHVLNLSRKGDVVEAAANLFAFLRALDTPEYKGIAVMPVPEEGLGIAINDRLRRAAAR